MPKWGGGYSLPNSKCGGNGPCPSGCYAYAPRIIATHGVTILILLRISKPPPPSTSRISTISIQFVNTAKFAEIIHDFWNNVHTHTCTGCYHIKRESSGINTGRSRCSLLQSVPDEETVQPVSRLGIRAVLRTVHLRRYLVSGRQRVRATADGCRAFGTFRLLRRAAALADRVRVTWQQHIVRQNFTKF